MEKARTVLITAPKIKLLETRLLNAIAASDLIELNALIADDLIFSNIEGKLISKEDDIDMHRRNQVQISTIEVLDSTIKLYPSFAVVMAEVMINNRSEGRDAKVGVRFTRIWCETELKTLQVVAGHASLMEMHQ